LGTWRKKTLPVNAVELPVKNLFLDGVFGALRFDERRVEGVGSI
jgi:hypothetical protein